MKIVGTFGSFTTARLGIYAAQTGLNLTGHNISNINSDGFTRQRLDQMALRTGASDRFGFTYNATPGNGVILTGISQIRDPFLDIRYRNESSSVGAMDAKLSGLEDIARILDEISRSDGEGVLEAQFNDMLKQLQNLSGRVGLEEYDTIVRSSATELVALLNSYADKLNTVYENQEAGFKQDVDRVNYILKTIGDLNNTILKSDIHGNPSLELRDQRNLLIDELSQYMKINVLYETISVGAGETAESLSISLAGTIHGDPNTSKSILIDGKYYTQVSITQIPDPDDPAKTINNPNFDLELSALMDSYNHIHDVFNAVVNLKDNDLYGSLQATREILTEAGEFTDDAVINGIPPIDPGANTKRGIPYYQKALDALALQFATVLNEANSGYMYNAEGVYVDSLGQPIPDYLGSPLTKDTVLDAGMIAHLQANDGVYLGGPLFSNSSDGNDTTGITAANLSVSKGWAIGDVRIVNSFQMGNGEWSATNPARPGNTDTANIEHIIVQFTGKQDYFSGDVNPAAYDPNTAYFSGSFQQMLTNINATLATDMNSTTSLLGNYVSATNELATSRDSVSGVDINDETVNLMQFQKAYSAACRLMTTLDEALEKLINGTGIVGR